ncbi:MAG: cell division protein FtsL, partial [Candidatus Kentron sp. G]
QAQDSSLTHSTLQLRATMSAIRHPCLIMGQCPSNFEGRNRQSKMGKLFPVGCLICGLVGYVIMIDRVLVSVLGLAILASSVGVVYVKHINRSLFVELQKLEQERDAMDVEWGKLALEQSTWATHDRIEQIAKEQLHLTTPNLDAVVLVMP